MLKKYFKTIILSDIHLGTKSSKADDVIDFLDKTKSDLLILNGDIIDGWALKRGSKWSKKHMRCVRKILKVSQKTDTYWIRGNHDDFLLDFIPLKFGKIRVREEMEYVSNGKKYIILHGDIFDIFITDMKFLSKIGSVAYDILLWLNRWYNKYRSFRKLEYFSLSNKIKQSVKAATSFIGKFEYHVIGYAKNKNADGIICGHIHHAEIKQVDAVTYMNSGDWVESLTALVETIDGEWKIIKYHEFIQQYNNSNTV